MAAVVGASGFLLLPLMNSLLGFELALVVLMAGMGAGFSCYWGLATITLGPKLAAVGIAVVNSAGALGSYASVTGLGKLVSSTGSYNQGYWVLGGAVLLAAVLVHFIPSADSVEQGEAVLA